MKADLEIVYLREQLKNYERRSAALTQQVRLLTGQRDVYAESQGLILGRNEDISNRLIEMNRKYENERAKPSFGPPVAWTISAVSASILAGFILKEQMD